MFYFPFCYNWAPTILYLFQHSLLPRSAVGSTWKMPSLAEFVASLTFEKDKVFEMGTLKDSNAHALTKKVRRNASSISRYKGKTYQA